MLKGKGSIPYTVAKIAFYVMGSFEYLFYFKRPDLTALAVLITVLIANGLLRQFIFYKKEKLFGLGRVSIALDFVLGVLIALQKPVASVILLITPSIFESVAVYSPLFGCSVSIASLISLIVVDVMGQQFIVDYITFFNSLLVSYGLGYLLIFVVSYLASLQFHERERIARVNRELEQAYKQLMENSSKLSELSIEKERNRMAREIHDTLAHTLTAVVVQLEAAKKLMGVDELKAKTEIEKAQELTRSGLNDVKRSIKALRPEILESNTLMGALENLFRNTQEQTHIRVILHENMEQALMLSKSAEVALFRVIQETLTNAIRHGQAMQVDLFMTQGEENLSIRIEDNGMGCSTIKEGYGLKGIGERIRELKGTVHFSSSPGKGFSTLITVPLGGATDND